MDITEQGKKYELLGKTLQDERATLEEVLKCVLDCELKLEVRLINDTKEDENQETEEKKG